jgi:hypothetical protein
MPRRCKFTQEEVEFIIENAEKGAKWLADEMGVNVAWIYQWGTDNKISVRKRDYENKRRDYLIEGFKKNAWKWPRPHYKWKKILVQEQGLHCHYCSIPLAYEAAEIDHVVPKAHGGTDLLSNLVISCSECNHIKGTRCYECPEFRKEVENNK